MKKIEVDKRCTVLILAKKSTPLIILQENTGT